MILTVAFGKGGSCKTSTAHALVNYAKMNGKKVLAVDCDPQGNFSYALRGDLTAPGLYALLTEQAQAADVIQKTQQADLISAGLHLAAAEQQIITKPGRDFILRSVLEPIKNNYDLVVIDTQPDLNVLLINALTASDTVLLTMQANSFAVLGLYQMQDTISQVKRFCNPDLTIAGIVLAKYKPRQTLASGMREDIAQQAHDMGTKVFNTYIREGVAVEQTQALQQSLFEYAPQSNPAKDYKALFEEMNLLKGI